MPPIIVNDADFRLGPVNLWTFPKPKAEISTTLGSGTNQDLTFRARVGGAGGNSITVEYVDPGTANAALSVSVDGTDVVVNLATNAASPPAVTSTAAQVRDALNASPRVRSLLYAVLATGSDGTGVVEDMAAVTLTGGSDTGVETFLGALTDETTVTMAVTAAPLTAHTTGSQPRGKVGTGGTFMIKAGLKEISLDRLAQAFPAAQLIEGAGGLRRLDFIVPTGTNFRDLAVKMELRRLLSADAETTDPDEILVIPACSPVDGEVPLTYNITDQQFIPVNYEAWPDSLGRLAYMGTAVL